MKQSRLRAAGALAAVAALAVPAVASGHGSVLQGTAKVVVPGSDPVTVTDETQYFVTNHGFSFVFRESNGITSADRGGMISYKLLPSAYRRGLTRDQILAEGDTGVQPHATCRGVASLNSTASVYAWQGADPFYNYVPFQTTSAGLEDEPALWLAVISDRTGVDLTTVTDAAAACTRLGGTYAPADAIVSRPDALASGSLAEAVEPLDAQIRELGTQLDTATRAKAAADAAVTALTGEKGALTALLDAARAQIASLIAAAKPLAVTPAQTRVGGKSVARSGLVVKLAGPPSAKVKITLRIGELRAKALRLRSSALATKTVTLGADGAGSVTLKPASSGAAAKALKALRGSLAATVSGTSGDRAASARVTLTR